LLTSPAFADGEPLLEVYTCNGDNISPPLSWENPPIGTAGFGLVFVDVSNGLIHSAMWDIAGSTTSLPEDVEKVVSPSEVPGAIQADAYSGNPGYAGPCPPNAHTYVFTLYAVDELPVAALTATSSRDEVQTALEEAALDTATLTVTYDPNNP
jgi:Raf kinase inhibitor-like YbhB/YbcL family protein